MTLYIYRYNKPPFFQKWQLMKTLFSIFQLSILFHNDLNVTIVYK